MEGKTGGDSISEFEEEMDMAINGHVMVSDEEEEEKDGEDEEEE